MEEEEEAGVDEGSGIHNQLDRRRRSRRGIRYTQSTRQEEKE